MASLEIMQRLHALEAQANELREQLEATKLQEQTEYAKEISDYCDECEWDPADIAKMLLPKRGRQTASKGTSRPVKSIWVNPKNPEQVYKGRGFPGWMQEEMVRLGLDTESKDDRIKFRQENLVERPIDQPVAQPAEQAHAA